MSSGSNLTFKPGSNRHTPFTAVQEYAMSKLGMWIFLATELLFFAGLFVTYSVYRIKLSVMWLDSASTLNVTFGAVNTVILLLSSFTVAWAVDAVKRGKTKAVNNLIIITLLCAAAFLGVKSVEYSAKTHEYELKKVSIATLYANRLQKEGKCYTATEGKNNGLAVCKAIPFNPSNIGSRDKSRPVFANLFYTQYFIMTGVHGLHIIIGMGLFIWLLMLGLKNQLNAGWYTPVEVVGLYWHLVDLIWIYLFPLLYLASKPH